MRTISIVGVGLIGASFGLAIRKAGFTGNILGVSSPASVKAGLDRGAIDRGATLETAAAQSDVIYLSQPIETIIRTLELLGPMVRPGCLITDAGSTKGAIAAAARVHLPPDTFLGGHPMAGKEQRGAQCADPDLFRDRPYVLTGLRGILNPNVDEFRKYLYSIGARIVEMSPEEHDDTVALTSHLPQLLSTALAATLAQQLAPHVTTVFGPGLLDMTRLALSAPEIWLSVLETNREAIDGALAAFQETLETVRGNLAAGNIADLFQQGQAFAARIRVLENS